MAMGIGDWESALIEKAMTVPEDYCEPYVVDTALLRASYAYCTHVTRLHSRTFYIASKFMSCSKRLAIHALYAFCRVSDDIVDRAEGNRAAQLAAWRRDILNEKVNNPILIAWRHTLSRYRIPLGYMFQLLDTLEEDLTSRRYATFDSLANYCYGVASTVGLMSMYIIGFRNREAVEYAVRLGIALQLTNILRDVGEDWRYGRRYLPLNEVNMFGLSESDLAIGCGSARWRDFMRFQIERTRSLYAKALPGLALLDRDGQFAVAAAAELYRAILDEIEAHDYDVFRRRAHTRYTRKLLALVVIAWRFLLNRYCSNP